MERTVALSGVLRMMGGDVNLSFDITRDDMEGLARSLAQMTEESVLAGFPADEKPREDENGEPVPITNAAIAYVQNTGMPELNIPARPFMAEGIEQVEDRIVAGMEATGLAAFDHDQQGVELGLHAVGATARDGIKMKIREGPFEPLKDSTLKARARRGGEIGKAAMTELDSRAAGNEPSTDIARPLNDTGQMRNAVNYVIRKE